MVEASHLVFPYGVLAKRMDVLPQDLVKSQSREIECYNTHNIHSYKVQW